MSTNLKERLNQKLTVIDTPISTNEDGEIQQVSLLPEIQVPFDEVKQRLAMLQQFVREYMVEGVDYGVIPGCKKPSLLKSGAEKLAEIYGLSKHIEVISRVEDWQQGFFLYEVKATLINKRTSFIEAEGVGNCNSKEKKYADQNPFSIANTILKMAKNRALVDAVLSATRSSAIFTQDMEDMNNGGVQGAVQSHNQQSTPSGYRPTQQGSNQQQGSRPSNSSANNQSAGGRPANSITEKQLAYMLRLLGERQFTADQTRQFLSNRYQVANANQLTTKQASDFIDFVKGLK